MIKSLLAIKPSCGTSLSPCFVKYKGDPAALPEYFTAVSAGLLAVAVGVFAFAPLIMQIALEKSSDPFRARERSVRAGRFFDLLLVAIGSLGLAVVIGIIAVYVSTEPLRVAQAILLIAGTLATVLGTFGLGLTFRAIRKSQ